MVGSCWGQNGTRGIEPGLVDQGFPDFCGNIIGKLCFYISPEWAVEGYLFNRRWFYKEFKNSNVDYKRILYSGNVDIREDWLDEI